MNLHSPRFLFQQAGVALVWVSLTACAGNAPSGPKAPAPPASPPAIVGADRDAHGCIGSAGYLWCERENSCQRPWELAKAKGFELKDDGFARYCGSKGAAKPSGKVVK